MRRHYEVTLLISVDDSMTHPATWNWNRVLGLVPPNDATLVHFIPVEEEGEEDAS